ncbi:MAG: hypothetical protein Q9195_002327 [Heterodermia aff. obscurata]
MIENYVSLDVIRQYTAKQDEIANACSLHCAQPSCKTMIPLENVEGSKGFCPICHKRTCRNCKLAWHESHVCNEGEEREKIVKLAKEKGWQFCFMCRNCVGISHGPIVIAQAEAVPAQAASQKRKLSIMDPIVDVDEPLVAEPPKRRHVNLALEGAREKAREKVLEAVCR